MSNSRNLADLLTSTGDVKSDALDNASSTPSITDSGNANAITIDSSENVGIGTTNPTEALEVGGGKLLVTQSATAKGLGYLSTFEAKYADECLTISVDGNKLITSEGYNTPESLVFHTYTSGSSSEKMRIENGNVGIGTTSPTQSLHVSNLNNAVNQGDNTCQLKAHHFASTNGAGAGINFGVSGDSDFVGAKITHIRRGSNSVGDLAFYTRSDAAVTDDLTEEAMRIDSDGNVGIGTDNPTEKLDVDGVIKAENVTTTAQIIDMSSLSDTTYYPVVLRDGSDKTFNNYELSVRYSDGSYSASVFCKFDFTGFSWGGNPIKLFVDSLHHVYENLLGAIGYVGHYKPVMYLKGGKQYRIKASSGVTPDIVTSIDTDYDGYSSSGSQYMVAIGPISESTMQADSHYLGTTAITTRTSKSAVLHLS